MKPRSRAKGVVPLCQAEYLQDVSIVLGKRLKGVRKACRRLSIDASREVDREGLEKHSIEAESLLGELTKIVLREDALAWVFHRASPESETRPPVKSHADMSALNAYAVADLIRRTLLHFKSVADEWKRYRKEGRVEQERFKKRR